MGTANVDPAVPLHAHGVPHQSGAREAQPPRIARTIMPPPLWTIDCTALWNTSKFPSAASKGRSS